MLSIIWFKLKTVFRYGIVSLLLFFALTFYAWDPISWQMPVYAFFFGIGIGIIQQTIAGNKFQALPFFPQMLLEMLFIVIVTIGAEFTIIFIKAYAFNYGSLKDFSSYLIDFRFFEWLRKFLILGPLVILFFRLESLIGKKMFSYYLIGKYNKPKKEERIFLFIDMKDSTTYAEKMENTKYYQMVNECIRLMTKSILRTDGEVLKYIGDEVVFSWSKKSGIKNNNCLELAIGINKELKLAAPRLLEEYGFTPFFKAGIHGGSIICAQMGDIKKEIDYSGDTMNTTARIQGMCNSIGAEILISESLFNTLPNPSKFDFEKLGDVSLKGKDERVSLIKVIP